MTEYQEKIFKSNNSISKFMGWKIDVKECRFFAHNIINWVDEKGQLVYGGGDSTLTDEVGFDYSIPFNMDYVWLIMAVEKIESMGYKVKICRKRCQICKDEKEEVFFIDVKSENKRNSVYDAVCQFVKINKHESRRNDKQCRVA